MTMILILVIVVMTMVIMVIMVTMAILAMVLMFVAMMVVPLFTGVRGIEILRTSASGVSPEFDTDRLPLNGCRSAQETVVR